MAGKQEAAARPSLADYITAAFPNTAAAVQNVGQEAAAAPSTAEAIGHGLSGVVRYPAAIAMDVAGRPIATLGGGLYGALRGVASGLGQAAGLGNIAASLAHAPVAAPVAKPASGAQAAAAVTQPPKTTGEKLTGALDQILSNGHVPFPILQAMTQMLPLYRQPLDAKNAAGMALLGLAQQQFQARMEKPGDMTFDAIAKEYQNNLEKAMGANPLQQQIAEGIQASQQPG